MDRATAHRIVLEQGWLSRQPPRFQAEILARAELLAFATGEHAYRAGEEAGGVHGIVGGSFGVHVAARPADPSLAHVMRNGAWFGLSGLFRRPVRTLSFRALELSWTLHVPSPALEEIAHTIPEAPRAVAAIADASLQVATVAIADLLIGEADRRIAATLLRVCGAGPDRGTVDSAGCRLTQAELGEMANASRGLVNRTLRAFEARGWVRLGYQQIKVSDAGALAAFVDPSRTGA